mgnify:CR=1 FL=1
MTIGTTKTFTVRCSAETEAKALARVEAEIERSGHGAKFKVTGRTATVAENKLIRSVEVEAPIAASVAVGDGVGYVGNMDRAVMAFDLDTGEVVWNYRSKNFPYFSSPALTAKQVLIGGRDKGLHCINRVSGKSEWRFAARGRIDSSPVVAGDKVVFGSMDGKLYLISLEDGTEIVSYEVGEAISSTPALASGRIFVGCEDGKIYAFSTADKK